MKKTMWDFYFYKYGKFCSVLQDKKVDLKPLFSEEWEYNPLSRENFCNMYLGKYLPNEHGI